MNYDLKTKKKLRVPNIIFTPPKGEEILLLALHLSSKLYKEESDRERTVRQIMDVIASEEPLHKRTIIVGDMNMNPFEKALTDIDHFHAVMDKRTALEIANKKIGERDICFYNPMWRIMGNSVQGPPGTYYYNKYRSVELFWHTVDQVLIRPSLIEYFREESLEIITSVEDLSLLDCNGRPDKDSFSDHLPLFFEIDI